MKPSPMGRGPLVSDGGHGHDHHADDREELGFAVVTISSTRAIEGDESGDRIIADAEAAGHPVPTRELVPDDYDTVQRTVDALAGRSDVDVIITTGGTGVTPDDVTIEAVRPLLDKELPGFGELFRRLSFDEIGTRVVGTRAHAGVIEGTLVFCLPGSIDAVKLGMESIILDVSPHLSGLAQPREDESEE